MSALSAPESRVNNLNGRSRSPSPAANSTVHNGNSTTPNITVNLLTPENANLLRTRRSATPDEKTASAENIPLIEAEKINAPLANPEFDDGDDREVATDPYPGIDDGFFSNRDNADGPTIPDTQNKDGEKDIESVDDPDGRRVFPRRPSPRFPLSPTDNNRPYFPDLELGPGIDLESIPDINVYQHKKTLAQGMMDLALFSANANQLRYVLESNMHPYYYPGIVLISISLIFQVLIGVGLIWNSRYNVKDEKQICIANKVNNFTIIGIFLVTVVNVFISAFGVASVQPVVATSGSAAAASTAAAAAVPNP